MYSPALVILKGSVGKVLFLHDLHSKKMVLNSTKCGSLACNHRGTKRCHRAR